MRSYALAGGEPAETLDQLARFVELFGRAAPAPPERAFPRHDHDQERTAPALTFPVAPPSHRRRAEEGPGQGLLAATLRRWQAPKRR
jgi:hypothetical protein